MIWRPRRSIYLSPKLPAIESGTGDFRPGVVARMPDGDRIAASLPGRIVPTTRSLIDAIASSTGDMRGGVVARMPDGDRIAVSMPGEIIASKPLFDTPPLPPGNFQPGTVAREPTRPGFAGRATATASYSFAQPPGALLPRVVQAKEQCPPGPPGRVTATHAHFPPEYAPPPARIVRGGDALPPAGRVRSTGTVSGPDAPTPTAYVSREPAGRPWPAGTVKLAGYAPPEQPAPIPQRAAVGQVESRVLVPIPPWIGSTRPAVDDQVRPVPIVIRGSDGGSNGRVILESTNAPPEPAPWLPARLVAGMPEFRWPAGSVRVTGSYDFSLPAGAILPRAIMVYERERPGFAGAVRSSRAAQDPFVPPECPIFESQAPPRFRAKRCE